MDAVTGKCMRRDTPTKTADVCGEYFMVKIIFTLAIFPVEVLIQNVRQNVAVFLFGKMTRSISENTKSADVSRKLGFYEGKGSVGSAECPVRYGRHFGLSELSEFCPS